MLLYCIRHGESAFNAEGRIQGQADIPLSPLGQRQSAALAAALSELPIQAVYSSPLQRAMQTAAPVADALGLSVQTDDRLKEIDAGLFQGLLWSEIDERYPADAAHWKKGEFEWVIPNGESRRQLLERGVAAFRDIRAVGLKQAVVVSHGGLLSATLKGLLNIPGDLNPFRFYNAAITKLEWEGQIKVLTVNHLEHLRAASMERENRTRDL